MDRGHRALAHTADIRIEAWAPTREACVEEAVDALVDAVARRSAPTGARVEEGALDPAGDEELLISALDEVIYRLDTAGEVPVRVRIDADGTARWSLSRLDDLEVVGAAPKAVSLHQFAFGPDREGVWRATVTIDV